MNEWVYSCGLYLICGLVVAGFFFGLGADARDIQWRNRLVDEPGYVAAIKSQVIAERATREARGE